VLNGELDSGYLCRVRAFWQSQTGIAAQDFQLAPFLVIRLSYLRASTITKGGRTHVEMKFKSPMVLLNINMPRNYYSPGCIHTLYDSGCTLIKSNFGTNGIVGPAPNLITIPWAGGVVSPTGGDSLPNYAQGRLLFSSGVNANIQFSIGNNDSNNLYLADPMDVVPAPGDGFTAYEGCSKTLATCTNKFSNQINFRGFPYVPPVYVSI